MKGKWKKIAFWVLGTEALGALSGFLSREGIRIYNRTIIKPPLSPPPPVFPIAWGILYALMGTGAAIISMQPRSRERTVSLLLFFIQLTVNFFWSLIFFNAQEFGFAFMWLLLLWALVLAMTLSFSRLSRTAALLQLPYLLWLTFAACLNLGVWYLNR